MLYSWNLVGCMAVVSAIVVHPTLLLLTFAWGALFGAENLVGSLGDGPAGQVRYGLEGGQTAFSNLTIWFLYFPILPLVVSVIAAVLGPVAAILLCKCRRTVLPSWLKSEKAPDCQST
jgi:hypothetical protein